jgi:hypothetical protein
MRTLFNIISLATLFLLTGCQQKSAAGVPLNFYIVSEEKIDGGQFVDTTNFPKLGYIHATPDLVITKLESVETNVSQSIILGKETDQLAVVIFMQQDDAKKFSTLTENTIGKKVLMMLGDKPLIAPRIDMPIQTPSLQISLGKQADQNDQKEIVDGLRQLVH